MNEIDEEFEPTLKEHVNSLADSAPAGPLAKDIVRRLRHRTFYRRLTGGIAAGLAAAAVLSVVILWGIQDKNVSQPITPKIAGKLLPAAAALEVVRETLPDGTKVVFQKSAHRSRFNRVNLPDVRTGTSRRARVVELSAGWAEFDVNKDAEPFVVKTPTCDVQVMGTQFEIYVTETEEKGEANMTGRKMKNLVTVAVLAGTVAVFNMQGQVSLGTGDQAVVKQDQAPNKGQSGEQGQSGQSGQQGQSGQKGQSDQSGQQGQSGQKGQSDQSGQQGQSGQKGQSDQQGQQGNQNNSASQPNGNKQGQQQNQ
ncbi:MAG: FecR domain-containing protein [Planctomycetes bacterium]|nr:FecR domain-containing protein [Planctomycetota bacterium]